MSATSRPTWGAISREGIGQWSWTLDTCGFLCRSIDDLSLLLDVFQVVDDDPIPETPFDLQGAKVGFAKTHNWSAAGPGTRNAMEKAQEILKAHGAIVEDVDLPTDQGFDKILQWHADISAAEGRATFLGHYRTDKRVMHNDLVAYVDNKRGVSRKQQLEAYDNCARLRTAWDQVASKYDLVLTPSIVDEAPLGLENTGDMVSVPTYC